MKRLVSLALAVLMLLSLVACGEKPAEESNVEKAVDEVAETFENSSWKIGIMTMTVTNNEESYRVASDIQAKYGEDKIVIQTFPDITSEVETTINNAMILASDPDVKAIVFAPANTGAVAAMQKIRETYPDILLISTAPQDELAASGKVADICYTKGGVLHGLQMVEEAKDMGCKYFIHYGFPRVMAIEVTLAKHDIIKQKCEEYGITFIDATTPDPQGDSGITGCQQFVIEDVANKIAEYGTECAFYGCTVQMQEPMIKAVAEGGAYYMMGNEPSPFQGFMAAFGLQVPDDKQGDCQYGCDLISEYLKEKDLTGHFGTWCFSAKAFYCQSAVEYAIAYLNGETNGRVDVAVLKEKMNEAASGTETILENYVDASGTEYDNTFNFVGGLYLL